MVLPAKSILPTVYWMPSKTVMVTFIRPFAGILVLDVLDLHVDVALAIIIGAQVVEIRA